MPALSARFAVFVSLLLFARAGPVFAVDAHTLVVRIFNGKSPYKRTFRLVEGRQFSQAGAVKDREMLFSGLLSRASEYKEVMNLEYQLELASPEEDPGRSIQVQAKIAMQPGSALTAVECGPWTVMFSMDLLKEVKRDPGAVWNPGGLPNYRLTAKASSGRSRQTCRIVSRAGIQSNVTDFITQGTRKRGFILNTLLTPAKDGNSFDLQYQIEHGGATGRPFQAQSEETLAPGKKTVIQDEGNRLEFLLEGPPRDAPGPARAEPEKEYGTVQFLQ